MILFRSLVFFILLVLSIAVVAPIITLCRPFPLPWRTRLAGWWSKGNLYLLKRVCGLGYEIKGAENFPSSNAIVLSKHQSAWETIALLSIVPGDHVWVMKRELLWVPLFGWALWSMDPIAINRKAGRKAVKQVVDEGTQRLREGRWAIIFPEGTRVAPGDKHRYGLGGALLAEKSGFPIVPIAHNAGVFWPRRGLKKSPGTIQVIIGPPIEGDGRTAKEILAEAEHWIEATSAELVAATTGSLSRGKSDVL